MELIVLIRRFGLVDQLVELRHRPAVQRKHLFRRDRVLRIETVEVAEAVAGRIAELQVVLAQLLENLLGAAHVDVIVGGARPQTDHVRAELIDQLLRIHAVAERLVHLAPFAVHRPAVGQAFLIRSTLAQRADRHQQRRLEPAAVLVAAFDVHRGGPEALITLHRGEVCGARVEPSVQGVGLFGEVLSAAVRADKAVRQKILCLALEPRVAAVLFENLRNGLDALFGADGFAAVVAIEHRDRQAPAALAGNAPVAALTDHGAHALLAPGGEPAHILAGGDGLVLEGIHRAEPLRSRAEDDGLLAAPAVRIAVGDVLRGEEHAALLHVGGDDGVGLFHLQPGVLAGVLGVAALIVHRDDHLRAVLHAGLIVDVAEAGRRVDAAGTGIRRDIVRQHQQGGLGQEGMIRQHVFKEGAGMGFDGLILRDAALGHDLVHQGLGHDVHLAVGNLDDRVLEVRVQGDAQVSGKGPGGRRPDHEEKLGLVQMAELALVVMHRELHIDRGDRVFVIFDLRLGQGGLVMSAPVNRLEALVDVAVAIHLAEDTHLVGLEAGVHRVVRMLPVADDTETLEACHLDFGIFLGIVVAGTAEIGRGHFLVVELLLLDNGAFDGHAVVVPAGDVGDIAAAHHIAAVDEILQGLVQRMAHVDVAVGEGRSVMEREKRLALVLLQLQVVQIHLFPFLEHVRLALGEAGTHREVGFRQVQAGIIILGHRKISWYQYKIISRKRGVRFRATPRHDSAFRSSLQVEGLCAAQVLPLGGGSQIEVGKVKIQRRFRSAGTGDLLLNRADRFVDVDVVGHNRHLLFFLNLCGLRRFLRQLQLSADHTQSGEVLAAEFLGLVQEDLRRGLRIIQAAFFRGGLLLDGADLRLDLALSVFNHRGGTLTGFALDLYRELLGRENCHVQRFLIGTIFFYLVHEDLHLALQNGIFLLGRADVLGQLFQKIVHRGHVIAIHSGLLKSLFTDVLSGNHA